MNHLGIDVVGKRKCRSALKDVKGKILDELNVLGNRQSCNNAGINFNSNLVIMNINDKR